MQTFLPYSDFRRSASVLDNRRLGKQRVETYQLYNALVGHSVGWKTHPAAVMWQGCIKALATYGWIICDEWLSRGYKDSLQPIFNKIILDCKESYVEPTWLGMERFHASHRSNLLRKDWLYYSKYGWTEGVGLLYVWPKPGDRA